MSSFDIYIYVPLCHLFHINPDPAVGHDISVRLFPSNPKSYLFISVRCFDAECSTRRASFRSELSILFTSVSMWPHAPLHFTAYRILCCLESFLLRALLQQISISNLLRFVCSLCEMSSLYT